MAFYGSGQPHDRHDGSYMNRSTTGRAGPVPEPFGRSAVFNPRVGHHDMDESDVQLPSRPEPIGIHPHSSYHGSNGRRDRPEREYRDRGRDFYQEEPYRRRPGPEYESEYSRNEYEFRRNRDMEFRDRSRHEPPHSSRSTSGRRHNAPSNEPLKYEINDHLHRLRLYYPEIYREWYKGYMDNPKKPPPLPGFDVPLSSAPSSVANFPIPRAPSQAGSMHYGESKRPGSGRSSVTEDFNYGPHSFAGGSNAPSVNNDMSSLPFDGYNSSFMPIQDGSVYSYQEPAVPPKFPGMHCFAIISPLGQLLTVKNGASSIEVQSLGPMLSHLTEYQKILQFPGPLIRGKVHKHTVIAFCEAKIKEAKANESQVDLEGFVLLWELLILLLRQNGSIIGSDIAELLVPNKSQGQVAQPTGEEEEQQQQQPPEGAHPVPSHPLERQITEAQAVKMFGDYLLFGHTKEALKYAIENNLWGHALTLAFKMEEKEFRNVMTRFITGMSISMPIVTLFEVMGGKSPASLANCCDTAFGDWKQHLAILLSNAGWKPEIETKSILTMGDTLGNKHHIYSSQFCYLMANLEFSPESKLGPLLGLLPDKSNVMDAILMTEIYEFARTLADPHYSIGSTFLEYKYEYVKLLIDFGFSRDAYSYCEEIVKRISQRDNTSISLKWSILQVAERLKSFDESSEDPSWIVNFKHKLQIDDQPSQLNGPGFADESSLHGAAAIALDQQQVMPETNFIETQHNHINTNQIQQPEPPKVDQQQYYQTTNGGNQTELPELNGGYNNYQQPYGNDMMNSVGEYGDKEVPDYYANQNQNDVHQQQQQNNYGGSAQQNYNPPNTGYTPNAVDMQQQQQIPNGAYYPAYQTDPSPYVQSQPAGNKKKVRFEDEDAEEDNEEGPYEDKTVKTASRMTLSPPNLGVLKQTSIPAFAPVHTSQELALISNDVHDTDTANDLNDYDMPPPALVNNPMVFKSTYPIDEPFGSLPYRPPTKSDSSSFAMSKSKTFPVDQQCCDVQKPCDEHDYLQYGSADFGTSKFRGGDQDEQHQLNQQQNAYTSLPPLPEAKPEPVPMSAAPASTPAPAKDDKKEQKSSGGWLPKFLSLKPKNQMKLPDDKNPAVVWDESKKRWVDTTKSEEENAAIDKPPPTDFELTRNVNNNYAPPPMIPNNVAPNFQAPAFNQPQMHGGPMMPVKNEMTGQQGNNNQTQNPAQINSGGPSSAATMNKYKLPKGKMSRANAWNSGSGTTHIATGATPNKPTGVPFTPPIFMPGPPPPGQAGDQLNFLTSGGFQPQPQSDNQSVPNVQQ